MSGSKVAVVYLNSQADFVPWHLAVRRLVKGYNMGDALMYTVPSNQYKAMVARWEEKTKETAKMKAEDGEVEVLAVGEGEAEQKVAAPVAPKGKGKKKGKKAAVVVD